MLSRLRNHHKFSAEDAVLINNIRNEKRLTLVSLLQSWLLYDMMQAIPLELTQYDKRRQKDISHSSCAPTKGGI